MYVEHKKETYEKAMKLRENGMSINKIAVELSVSKSTISRWVNKVSLPTELSTAKGWKKRVLTDELRAKLSESAKKGNSMREYSRKPLSELSPKSINSIKREVFKIRGRACELCGWDKVNPITGTTPTQVHHVDGDRGNVTDENLKVLCPNCHSLTPNFMFYGRKHDEKTKKHLRKVNAIAMVIEETTLDEMRI